MSAPEFVFVAGCGHSGTTLMATILGSHSAIHTIPTETAIFFGDQSPVDIRDFLQRARERQAPEKSIVCEKTPPHVRCVAKMLHCFPDARIVLILRDGRDVVASLKRQGVPFAQALDRWVGDTSCTLAAARSTCVVTVRYEMLLAAMAATVAELCAFVGVPFEEPMLRFHEHAPNWFGVGNVQPGDRLSNERRRLRNWQVHQPLFDGRGRWRTELCADEISQFDRAASDLMLQLGYQHA